MRKIEKEIKKWWEEASQYYQKESKISTKSAHYGPYSPTEDKLRLLGNIKGKKILEIGCGGGQCSIAFAKKGAKCIGVDISEEQLKYAKKLAQREKVNIEFRLGSFQNLSGIESQSHDIVFSAFALQYSPNLNGVFRQVYRILKKKGLFVFSLEHPLYQIIDYKTKKIFTNYKTEKIEKIEIWPDGSKHKFIIYNRKISDLFNALVEGGFVIEKIIEPLDLKVNENPNFPKDLVKLIGPTIIFKSRKE